MKRPSRRFVLIALLGTLVVAIACAALGFYRATGSSEQWGPIPPVVAPKSVSGKPPPNALILFGGTDLNEWVNARDGSPASWTVDDGVVTVNKASGNIATRRRFGNFQLHLEWRVPKGITGEGQFRGNSGVFLASTGPGDAGYELQVLDPWYNPTYVNGQAGAIYKQFAPLANPGRPPGEWQYYDILWTAPVFASNGTLRAPARVTVIFNGVLVQDNVALAGETRFIGKPEYHAHGAAPIKLQAHGDPSALVSFRNIWVHELR